MLPIYNTSTEAGRSGLEACLRRLAATAGPDSEAAETVRAILADVAEHGDAAVVDYMRRWTDPSFDAQRIRVAPDELDAAAEAMPGELRAAIERAIANVRAYQEHVMPADAEPVTIAGAELGLRWTAVPRVGLCVPGGTAVLFSTLVMLAVPALVAGVRPNDIHVISPPPTAKPGQPTGDISPLVLGTAKLLGLSNVYRIGGAQGVAALGHGTQTVPRVDLIAGPGNVFVQLAKAQLGGACGTDNGFYGPSEIVTVADATADPARVAADLLAQAEHDPGKCFLIAWEPGVIERVVAEIARQFPQRRRGEAIAAALRDESCAVRVANEAEAVALADRFAAEHVNLAVADPAAMLKQLRHAGEVFLGDAAPVAAGDYYAGPSHCLPTGTTARFTSGVSVYTFLKRTGTVAYPGGMPPQVIDDIALLADAEGLDAHAASSRIR